MAGTTTFPASLDTFPAIAPSTQENVVSHSAVHENVHASVLALQAKVGIDSSADTDSIDHRLAAAETLAGAAVPSSELGVSVATLVGGLVPSAQLPSYVDDVIEVANVAALPGTGESGKIYITIDTEAQYRWSGTAYIELVQSPGTTDALTEGTANLYFTPARVLAVVLSGLSTATNAAIDATDSILAALGKLQKQLTDLLTRTTGTNTGDQTSVTGNAGTATKLATARAINGVAFDGSADITITGVGGSGAAWTNCGHWSFGTDGAVSQFFSSAIGAYSEALIVFDQVSMSSVGWREIQVSVDGGSTYLNTSANYRSIDTNGVITNEGSLLAHSTSSTLARSANVGIGLMNSAVYKPVDTPARGSALAQIVTTSTITNLRVFASAGNFNGGTIQIWCR